MRREMLREITRDEVETFWRDGVVCLRGVIDQDSLDFLVEPIEELMTATDIGAVDLTQTVARFRSRLAAGEAISDPTFGEGLKPEDFLEDDLGSVKREPGKFFSLTHVNPLSPPIRRFETASMLPEAVARVLRASKVSLFVDQVFVKEPGTAQRTAFHVDESYFNLTGEQVCTAWTPLDRVTSESGAMGYVRGSHLWPNRYLPNNFITQKPLPRGTQDREPLPDIEGRVGEFDLVSFDVEPGDVIIHHYRTVHGSGGNRTSDRRRRALAVRYCGDDVRWGPGSRAGERLRHDLREGDPLDKAPDVFPVCWTEMASA